VGLLFRAFERLGVVVVHPDEVLEILDAKVGERQDSVLADAVNPDDAVLDLHFIGNVRQPTFVFAEFRGG